MQLQPNLPPPREEEFDLKDIFRVLRRRLATIVGTVVILTSFAGLLALNLTPEYTATSTIVVEPRETRVINLDQSQQNIPQDQSVINTHVKELTSTSFARQTIEKLDLLSDPQFNVALTNNGELDNAEGSVSGEADTLISAALSWARAPLVAIGLANQPPGPLNAPDRPVDDKLDRYPERAAGLGPVAASQGRDHETGKARNAERLGVVGTADEPGPDLLDGGAPPADLHGAAAGFSGRLLDQPEEATLDPAINDRGVGDRSMGGDSGSSTARLHSSEPRIVPAARGELVAPERVARAAGIVPEHKFGVEQIDRTGEAAGERDDLSSRTPLHKEGSGASALVEDGEDDALMAAASKIFLEQLDVAPADQSYAISVAFTSVDPETAARVANAMSELFVENQLEVKLTATNGALDWLAGRLNELRAQLVEADRAAETYREKNHLLASGRGLEFNDQELAALSQELIKARAERLATEAKVRQIQQLRSSGKSLDSVPDVLMSPIIADLRQKQMDILRQDAQLRQDYGPRHPKIIQIEAEKQKVSDRIDAEIQHVIGSLENQIATTQVREQTLQAKVEEAKAGSLENSRAEIQLRLLERDADSTRTLYATFLDKFKQLTEERELLKPGARVISKAAVPTEPSFPRVKLMTGAGFMGSLMFGVLLAFVVDRLDGGLRTGRQAETVLNVPSIGLIPKLGRALRGRGPYLYLAKKPISPYAEAIRSVQTALYFSNVDQPPQVVLVTSSLPAEGKTTLALSLAALLAASGCRTVALDLDLRAPALGRRLKNRDGDLIDYMRGERTLDQVLHEVDEVDNLDIIPTRRLVSNPTDLLASQRMADLMTDLRARYQYVILDSPPLLGLSDTRFAAHLADAAVFVIRWSRTGEEIAQKALTTLRDSGTRVAGAVLTQVNVRRLRKYSPADVAHYYGRYRKYYMH